jgi:Flp pilus assembly protein TadD/SAM-dependent methyltransferase
MDGSQGRAPDESGPARASQEATEDAEALFAQGLSYHQLGSLAMAESLYEQVLAIAPDHANSLHLIGVAADQMGRHALGLERIGRAIEIDGSNGLYHYNYGNALRNAGRMADAAEAYGRAAELRPALIEAHNNLGNALRDLGRLDQARAAFETAIRVAPDFADAQTNLGNVLLDLGRPVEAVAAHRAALALTPKSPEVHADLARALIDTGEEEAALPILCQSLWLGETMEARSQFVRCLKSLAFGTVPPEIGQLALRSLHEEWAAPRDLLSPVISLVKATPGFADLASRSGAALDADGLAWVAGSALLMALLEVMPVCDGELERLLTGVRSGLLYEAAALPPDEALDPEKLEFCCALARQCFVNEYIFPASAAELTLVEELRRDAEAALLAGRPVGAAALVIIACYVPLHQLADIEQVLELPHPRDVRPVLVQQVAEPREERNRAAELPRLTTIEDEVSCRVRRQYEANPYPRWVKAGPAIEWPSIDRYLQTQFPDASYQPLGKLDPDILIAGCGTGTHPIQTARMFPKARVVAIDLSRASLSYAARQTRQLGLRNLRYAQADLLELPKLGRQFDIVEAVGVLHHLADPFAGLARTAALLRPGGVLNLGLYSRRGREPVAAIRDHIVARGFGPEPEDIRSCRQELFALAETDPRKKVLYWQDFGSVSGCRDLLFHAEEHGLDLVEIAGWLERLGLTFLGMTVEAPLRRAFHALHPDRRAATDLRLWDAFERQAPDSFAGMYRFWVQKAP